MNLLIAKHRNDPTGEVRLTFLRAYTRFESAPPINEADVSAMERLKKPGEAPVRLSPG